MAVLAGFAQLHSLAEIYVDRALAVAESVNQPPNLITVRVVTSVYKITVGKWDEVRARAEEAKVHLRADWEIIANGVIAWTCWVRAL